MCGIVGLFIKDAALRPELGALLSEMLVTMTDRGPDSAGIAIYRDSAAPGRLTLQSDRPEADFDGLAEALGAEIGAPVTLALNDTHAVALLPAPALAPAREAVRRLRPGIRPMSLGERVEIYKEVGRPADVVSRLGIAAMSGTHGIGHTRMATESAVTTEGAHPFSTGPDQCLVHNGSLSNHNNWRRKLLREGVRVESRNDSEIAAAYLTWKMEGGATLGEALQASLDDLDGFFNFVVGTRDGFGVLRDPIACKPAVMAETEGYVAFGSEYRALAVLPGIDTARVWEPEPATAYFWSHAA